MPQVAIYSTPTCPYCNMAKQFLAENKIEYANYDVSADTARAQEMIDKSGQMGVPVIDIDGEIIVGFDRDRVAELLKITK